MKKYTRLEVEAYVDITLLRRIEYGSLCNDVPDLINHLYRMLNSEAFMGMRAKSEGYKKIIEEVVLSKQPELIKLLVRNAE